MNVTEKIGSFRQALRWVVAVLFLFSCSPQKPSSENEAEKQTLRRSDSFFGLHFDFHANKNDSTVGKTFTAEMIDSLLTMVQPDYIQVDCKGHPGISSYPTKVGNAAPGFVKDPLKIWREVTRKHKVALFVHYSGVWDDASAEKHPEWMALNAEGKKIGGRISVKGPYVDSLLIPQFKELIDNYDIDGCWIDGECWALQADYSPKMISAFRAETGIRQIPKSFSDPGGYEFNEFNRKAFRQYVAHYTDVLHRYNPEFQVTSNWAFSSHMPEPVDINIDFISGDFSHVNSVYSGFFESRCIAPQGKPWDLMAWSFAYNFNTGVPITKSAAQLKQLAATVMSMGGGYQVYFQQNRDASPQPWQFGLMKEVAGFCRERQPFCQNAKPVPQVALLYSSENYKKFTRGIYSNSSVNEPLRGMLNLLLNGQNAVEILMEHHLKGRMLEYPLIVIPECRYLADDFKTELLAYVENGGNLLVVGAGATALFTDALNVEFSDTAVSTQFLAYKNEMAGINTLFQPVKLKEGATAFGSRYPASDLRFPSSPAASVASYGKGKIAGVYLDISKKYNETANPVYRDFVGSIVRELFPAPVAGVKGSANVAVTVNRLGVKLAVNLINTSGDHSNEKVARYDEIPAVGPLSVKIRTEKAPRKLLLQPENLALDFTFSNGVVETTVDRLVIHSILVLD
ncbi:hypothetical protein [Gaoshiqia sp. Z1-71]|uniref:hypothetical protein n=1 Tax=Gaoshiqia hydrogeniformans TaxID=3290090 RepID=UPI003BF84F5B